MSTTQMVKKLNFEILAPGIYVYKNVIDNFDKTLSEIEDVASLGLVKWESSMVYSTDKSVLEKDHRDTNQIHIPYPTGPIQDEENPFELLYDSVGNIFKNNFDQIENQYCVSNLAVTKGHEGYTILKYGVGQKFNLHVDDHPDFTRRISMVYYPNDNYEGGEITFDKFGITYKPKANELIIFPSSFMYSHKVAPVTSGTRYAVVTWIN